MQALCLGQEDPLEWETPVQYSCLENSIDRGAYGLQSIGLQRIRHDSVTEHANRYGNMYFNKVERPLDWKP